MTLRHYTRREMLALSGKGALAGALAPRFSYAAAESSSGPSGAIVGDNVAATQAIEAVMPGGGARFAPFFR